MTTGWQISALPTYPPMQIADASPRDTHHFMLFFHKSGLDCALPTFVTESRPQQSKTVDKIGDTATHQWSRGSGSSRSRCRINSDFIISILKPGNKGPDEKKDNYKNYWLTVIAGAIHQKSITSLFFTVHCIGPVGNVQEKTAWASVWWAQAKVAAGGALWLNQ